MISKYRGKDKVTGEWRYGFYVQRSHRDCCVSHFIFTGSYLNDENQNGFEVERYTVHSASVGQWTGLKDKAGVEIYQDDKLCNTNDSEPFYWVRWDEKDACFTLGGDSELGKFQIREFWEVVPCES